MFLAAISESAVESGIDWNHANQRQGDPARMSAFHLPRQHRFGAQRHGLSFAALLALTFASAVTGAVVALIVQRFAQRHQLIEVLPSPAPIHHLRAPSSATTSGTPASSGATGVSPLGAVAANLTASRTVELEQLVADHDDVMAGDGSMECPSSFPIKGNGRSGIYHWPGSHNYQQTQPTLCFRTMEAAERAGFRAAVR